MKFAHIGAFAATVASLSATSYGYSFSDTQTTESKERKTDLTKNTENRIYGGEAANIGNYPFLASLRDAFFDQTFCAGTLIHPQYILTAGHCIRKDFDIVATFGTNESTGDSSGKAFSVPVIKGFQHPMYRKKEHLYDVGLLKLERRINHPKAKLCARDGSDDAVGTFGTALGWGKTEDSGESGSPYLKELRLPIISNAECGKFEKYVGRVTEGMLCAGTGNGKDTCNGDSGGPLIVDGNILVGCVSWGSTCGQQPGIFTRITYVMDYIEDILAGGDGSKFDVGSSKSESTSGSIAQYSGLDDDTQETAYDSGSGDMDLSWLFEGSNSGNEQENWAWLMNMLKSLSASGSTDQFSDFIDSSDDTDFAGKSDDTVQTKDDLAFFNDNSAPALKDTDDLASKGNNMVYEDSSLAGQSADVKTDGTPAAGNTVHDLDWLFADESGSDNKVTLGVKGGNNIENNEPSKARKAFQVLAQTANVPRDPASDMGSSSLQIDPLGAKGGNDIENIEPSKARKAFQVLAQTANVPRDPTSDMGSSSLQIDPLGAKGGNDIENDEPSKARKAFQVLAQTANVPRDPMSDAGSLANQIDTFGVKGGNDIEDGESSKATKIY